MLKKIVLSLAFISAVPVYGQDIFPNFRNSVDIHRFIRNRAYVSDEIQFGMDYVAPIETYLNIKGEDCDGHANFAQNALISLNYKAIHVQAFGESSPGHAGVIYLKDGYFTYFDQGKMIEGLYSLEQAIDECIQGWINARIVVGEKTNHNGRSDLIYFDRNAVRQIELLYRKFPKLLDGRVRIDTDQLSQLSRVIAIETKQKLFRDVYSVKKNKCGGRDLNPRTH